jgi:hypothetical protein
MCLVACMESYASYKTIIWVSDKLTYSQGL